MSHYADIIVVFPMLDLGCCPCEYLREGISGLQYERESEREL